MVDGRWWIIDHGVWNRVGMREVTTIDKGEVFSNLKFDKHCYEKNRDPVIYSFSSLLHSYSYYIHILYSIFYIVHSALLTYLRLDHKLSKLLLPLTTRIITRIHPHFHLSIQPSIHLTGRIDTCKIIRRR